jgi:hypothetical protein
MLLETKNYSNFFDWFEQKRIEQTVKNRNECIQSAKRLLENIDSKKDSWLKVKISNYLERHGFDDSIKDVLLKISKDSLFAAHFSKPFMKQGVEETQLYYLKDKYDIDSYRGKNCEFPITANGKNSYRFDENGNLKKGIKKTNKTSKSIDSIIKKDTNFWITQKVTTDDGGATNSVNDDIIKFLKPNLLFFKNNPNSTDKFVYLLDGPYWKRKNRITDNYNRIELLQKEYKHENIIICDSDEFGKKYGNK